MDGHPTDILCLPPGYESLSSRQKKPAGDKVRELWKCGVININGKVANGSVSAEAESDLHADEDHS